MTSNDETKVSIKEILKRYKKEDLAYLAEDYGCDLKKSATKDQMAYTLARYFLDPENMKKFFLDVEVKGMDLFDKVFKEGFYIPSEEDLTKIGIFLEAGYLADYQSPWGIVIRIPDDVRIIYGIIRKNGYRTFHRKASWLLVCENAFDHVFRVGPENILYQMYQRRQTGENSFEEFKDMRKKIPYGYLPCVLQDGKAIGKEYLQNDMYRRIEAQQRDVDYYILTEKEILCYAEGNVYLCEKSYADLKVFFEGELKRNEAESKSLCANAFAVFSTGGMPSHFMELLDDRDIVFDSEEQVRRFVPLMMEVINHTRMAELRGHMPSEMKTQRRPATAARKKIYPNDPCPCGSGKKYKNCCARKR